MRHLEICIGKQVSSNIRGDVLKNLPSFVEQLTQKDSTERLTILEKILDHIGTVQIQMCRAEQFNDLLNELELLIVDAQSKEAEIAIQIIEIISTKYLDMIKCERNQLKQNFKGNKLTNTMLNLFMDQSTPAHIKESLAYSISEFEIISNNYDEHFIPILDLLFLKLQEEENRLIHANKSEQMKKRNRYGLTTLETILDSISAYSFGTKQIQKEIANRKGIEIGSKYIQSRSAKIRVCASCLLDLARNQDFKFSFKYYHNFLTIINKATPIPALQVVKTDFPKPISPIKRIPQLHSGWIDEIGLCVNCDLKQSSYPTQEKFDYNYRFIRNLIYSMKEFIEKDINTVKQMCSQMQQRSENDEKLENKKKGFHVQNDKVNMTRYSDPLSKVFLYLCHPYTVIRSFATQLVDNVIVSGEKEWIVKETKEIRRRRKIKKNEWRNMMDLELNKGEKNENELKIVEQNNNSVHKCSLSALPLIFFQIYAEEDDDIILWSLWTLFDLLKKLIQLRNKEKEEEAQKKMEKDDTDFSTECEYCGEMVLFSRFLSHMKKHNQLKDMKYEMNYDVEVIAKEDEDESDCIRVTQKRVLEDIEEDGLIESAQSFLYQDSNLILDAAKSISAANFLVRNL